MYKPVFCLTIAALAVAGVASVQTNVKKVMNEKVTEALAAFKSRNLAWFEKNSTDDYTETEKGKTFKKAEAMAQLKQVFAMSKSVQVSEEILSITMQGKNALVKEKTHFVGTLASPQGSGKTMKMEDTSISSELWVPVGSDYKLKYSKSISDNMLLDGKPFKGAM